MEMGLLRILGTGITLIGLLALTIAIVARTGQRHFAVVPRGTVAGPAFRDRQRPRHAGHMAGGGRARPRANAQASGGRAHNVLARSSTTERNSVRHSQTETPMG